MDMSCFLVATVFLVVYLYLTRNYSYWKNQNVPYAPYALPGIGHSLRLLFVWDNLAMWAERLYEKMGKRSMYGYYFMQTPTLVIRDPELIKRVLQTNFTSFQNNMATLNEDLDPIMAKNPFFAKGDIWKKSRQILGNNFSGKKLRGVFTIILQVCDEFKYFVDGHISGNSGSFEFELKDLFARITGEMVANSALGIEGQSFRSSPDYQAFTNVAKRLFETSKINGIEQSIRFCFPNLADRLGLRLIPKETDLYLRKNVKAIIKSRLLNTETRSDFLQYIIKRMNRDLDENMAVAQVTSLFFDGYDTLSSVLSFVIYRLAENPHIQEKVRQEVFTVLKEHNNQLTCEAIKNMHYLERVMCETMRLNPCFGELIKVCNKQTILQGYDKLSCSLEPGDLILISVIGLHMDKEFWPNPSVFDPDRFDTINKEEINKFTYLAFGEGSRMCIGKRLGIITVKAATAIILQRYSLESSSKTILPLEMNPNSFSWVAKGGLWALFKPLSTNN